MSAQKELLTRTRRASVLVALLALVIGLLSLDATAQDKPAGETVLAWHVTIAPAWFDPIDTPAQITPYGVLHALHDALVRPLPGEKMGNGLARSWTESPDGLVYEFQLREGLKFHNGDPFTAEDVKFSFERYRGVGANELHAKVKAVEAAGPYSVRFVLHAPWLDFIMFYGTTATAAGIVVPKQYSHYFYHDPEGSPAVSAPLWGASTCPIPPSAGQEIQTCPRPVDPGCHRLSLTRMPSLPRWS